ncbi:SDR family oxidoreductase [Roseivirga sp. BDSF3-8]|uniref:SDR family oxidoreductase n=1 Tax=Roseivirga sp. BDSF3-8 TaxID=3241598 RepID=UPI00353223EC
MSKGKIKNQFDIQDPREQYPKPPFPKQPQPRPGLTHEMDPKPDHGEESYQGTGRLKGRKALVTGGDSGIGRATAIAYAREGADVAINYLPEEEENGKQVIKLIEEAGQKAVAIPGDVSKEAFCKEMVDKAASELGGLDILVSNSGRQTAVDDIAELTTEQYENTFKVNAFAQFWICKAALPHMKPGASIIITSSIQAFNPSPNLLDYAQTKACNVAFTKALSKQVMNKGIRVNSVAPGPFWTPLQPSGGQPQEKIEEFGSTTPYGRPGQPAEIAPAYVMLASQEASYMTGEVVGVTGGKMPY